MLKLPNKSYGQWSIMAFILQPPFKFQPAAHHTGHLILAPKGYQTVFIIVKLKLKQAAQWSCECSFNRAKEALSDSAWNWKVDGIFRSFFFPYHHIRKTRSQMQLYSSHMILPP
jgi:hypothetical protein